MPELSWRNLWEKLCGGESFRRGHPPRLSPVSASGIANVNNKTPAQQIPFQPIDSRLLRLNFSEQTLSVAPRVSSHSKLDSCYELLNWLENCFQSFDAHSWKTRCKHEPQTNIIFFFAPHPLGSLKLGIAMCLQRLLERPFCSHQVCLENRRKSSFDLFTLQSIKRGKERKKKKYERGKKVEQLNMGNAVS